jgi:raffinose/stachyose/melibiose transport system permease protein
MTAVSRPHRGRRIARRSVMIWVGVFLAAIIWALPILFMIFTSLKDQADIYATPPYAPPVNPAWDNYSNALSRGDLVQAMINSGIIVAIKVPIGLAISALAAFALSRLRFRYQRLLLALIAIGTMVPIQVAIAPLFRTILALGLLNTYVGVILPYIAFGVPFQVFILYGFFRAIPRELDEAARLDGASNLALFARVILPLARPALAALFVLDFVATWNEFAIALVVLQAHGMHTVPLALQGFNTQFATYYGELNAAIMISIIPVVIVFLRFQRYFISGAFSGAIRG